MALYADWFLHAFVKKGEDAAAFSPFPYVAYDIRFDHGIFLLKKTVVLKVH